MSTAAVHADVFSRHVHILLLTPVRCNRRSRRALARFGSAAPARRGCIYNANAEQRQHARSSGTFARYDDASARVMRAVAGDGGRESCRHDHGGQGVAHTASAAIQRLVVSTYPIKLSNGIF